MNKKMQSVNFSHIEAFMEFLPPDELEITQVLRQLIFDCIPGIQEKLSYNVPFYYKRANICFLWPASVLWGKKKTYNGVRLGFNKGYLMQDEINYLKKEKRKYVYWHDFISLKDIDVDLVKSYLFEAAMLDKQEKNNPVNRI